MTTKTSTVEILAGTKYHDEVPPDMIKMLRTHPDMLTLWNNLTELARNEWICRVTIVKQDATRAEHILRMQEDILAGKKRPCCRPGCPHRRPSAAKYFK